MRSRAARVAGVATLVTSLCASGGATGAAFSGRELVVEDPGRPRVLHVERVVAGATFSVEYRHSSEGVAVRGAFRVEDDGSLTVVETAFGGFGPGLPELTPDDDWRIAGGMIVHRPYRRRLVDLRLRATAVSRPRLTMPSGRALDLAALAGNGSPVLVRVR